MSNKINIGVTGTGSLIGQAIIKSVQRSQLKDNINFIGFDYFNDTVGSFWCTSNYMLPDILDSVITESQWLAFLIDVLQINHIKVLFVGVDFELPILAKNRSYIENLTGTKIMVCSVNVITISDDKYLTYKFLKENNFAYPQTWLEDEFDLDLIKFPVIVKPRHGARSVGVSKVYNESQLVAALRNVKQPIVQECIGIDEEEFTCGVIFLDGELKKSIVLNRSLKEGNTFISKYSKDFPEIISQYLKNVAVKLDPFGACNFQLRLDSEGTPKIFEINARHSGTTFIRTLFGFKEVEYILNYLIYNKEQAFVLKEGTVVRFYDEFFLPPNY